jgi:hypothetical protein
VHHHSPSSVNLLHRVTPHKLLRVELDFAGQGHKPNGQKTSWLQLELMPIFGLPQMLRGINLYTTRKPTFYDKNAHDGEEYRHTMCHNMMPW